MAPRWTDAEFHAAQACVEEHGWTPRPGTYGTVYVHRLLPGHEVVLEQFGGRLTITHASPSGSFAFESAAGLDLYLTQLRQARVTRDELTLAGHIGADLPAPMILRRDDAASPPGRRWWDTAATDELTTAGMVGTDPPAPMSLADVDDLARDFMARTGRPSARTSASVLTALRDYAGARALRRQEANALQRHLVTRYGIRGLAQPVALSEGLTSTNDPGQPKQSGGSPWSSYAGRDAVGVLELPATPQDLHARHLVIRPLPDQHTFELNLSGLGTSRHNLSNLQEVLMVACRALGNNRQRLIRDISDWVTHEATPGDSLAYDLATFRRRVYRQGGFAAHAG